MYAEDDLLPLSALQHLSFCERQCALIHVERVWHENQFTAEGRIMHGRAHEPSGESRPGVRTRRAIQLRSLELGVAGVGDVVEFRSDGTIYPLEYKRGRRKAKQMDEVQLCAQALCLEEMLGVAIGEGAIFYGKERRRKSVPFNDELRALTRRTAARLHEIVDGAITPPPVLTPSCRRCSLIEDCMPGLFSQHRDVARYIRRMAAAPIEASPQTDGEEQS